MPRSRRGLHMFPCCFRCPVCKQRIVVHEFKEHRVECAANSHPLRLLAAVLLDLVQCDEWKHVNLVDHMRCGLKNDVPQSLLDEVDLLVDEIAKIREGAANGP